jgi:hypothetical protein
MASGGGARSRTVLSVFAMANGLHNRVGDWVVRLTGALSDLHKIAAELASDPWAVVHRDSLELKSSEIDKAELQIVAEWEAIEFVRLLSAATCLHFGIPASLHIVSVERARDDFCGRSASMQSSDLPTFQQIIGLALDRPEIRRAFLAYAVGGAGGLFEAYESISSEALNLGLPEQATYVGAKEWFVRQGWITHGDGDRFLNTVLHFRHAKERQISFEPIPPNQAEIILRGLLTNFLRHCIRLKIPMPVSDQRGECC